MSRSDRPSRRQMLRLGAGTLLAAGCWPGWARADEAETQDFTFLCVNDLHYFDKHCNPFFDQMVRQMKATDPAPDFCLVVGDLAEDGTPAQLGTAKDFLKSLGMPAPVVIGNHDYVIPADDRKAFVELFPDSLNYRFGHKGWQFVALDTTQGRQGSNTRVAKETTDWLAGNIAKLDKKRPTVLFTHFPLGHFLPSRPANADDVLSPFKEHNLQAVFNGHFHAYTERRQGQTILTTDKCCSFHHANHDGTKEKGYFVCRAKDGSIQRSFVEVKTEVKDEG